jgi:hypothetical protein
LRNRFGEILYKDSIVRHCLPRNAETTQYVFNTYYKDSLPVSALLCKDHDIIYILAKNNQDPNNYNINDMLFLCNELKMPPSEYYENDTSVYSKIVNNVRPIYLPPNKSIFETRIYLKSGMRLKKTTGIWDFVIDISKNGKEVNSIRSKEDFDKFFEKTKINGERKSYICIIKD